MVSAIAKGFGLIFLFMLGFWLTNTFFYTADKAIDLAPVRYEEYQELYNTCKQISDDMCSLNNVSPTDPMFSQFSKEQRMNALRDKMNRWTNDYNAKSQMNTRSLWKSPSLPQTIHGNDFPCY